MLSDVELKEALVALRLEELIPVWEAASDPDVLAACDPAAGWRDVSEALIALANEDRVHVYLGRWWAEPNGITVVEAASLLRDVRYFSAETEPDGYRLYYVNVDNVPGA